MNKHHDAIEVNGRRYDPHTGLPISDAASPDAPAPSVESPKKPTQRTVGHAAALHATTQRSRTLHRKTPTKLPAPTEKKPPVAPAKPSSASPRVRHINDISMHPQVNRFARTATAAAPVKKVDPEPVAPHTPHPVQTRAHAAMAQRRAAHTQKPAHKTAQQIKKEVVAAALNAPATKPETQPAAPSRKKSRMIALALIISGALLFVGSIIWMNLPVLSVKYAAMTTGIDASYPDFVPNGYELRIPAATDDKSVALTFASQDGTDFTLTQSSSSWDSTAVRADVEKQTDGQFLTTQDRGLTIYTYSGNAMWVNKGMLYQITGGANLSNEQIRRIASSL